MVGLVLMIILWVVVIAALVLGIWALIHASRRRPTEGSALTTPPAGTYKPKPAGSQR